MTVNDANDTRDSSMAAIGLARLPRAVVWLLLAVSGIYFLIRGPMRAIGGSWDLAYGYSAAVAWLNGLNPYDQATLITLFEERGGVAANVGEQLIYTIHPPPALPIYLTVSLGDWDTAAIAAPLINLAVLVLAWMGLTRFLGWHVLATPAILLAAFMLALAPVHRTMMIGQSGLVVVGLLVWSMVAARGGHPIFAGVMLAVASALKVTLGSPFIAYALVRQRWRVAITALLVIAVLIVVSVARLEIAGVDWMGSFTGNLQHSLGPGGLNSPASDNEFRFSLIQLQYLLVQFIDGESLASLVGLALVLAAALVTVWLVSDRTRHGELLAQSLVAVLTLLATYHRYYDAVLLFFPIAWGLWALSMGRWIAGGVVLALCANFIVPLQAVAPSIASRYLPDALTDNVIWTHVVLTQHVWALVLLAAAMLGIAAMDKRRGEPDEPGFGAAGDRLGARSLQRPA